MPDGKENGVGINFRNFCACDVRRPLLTARFPTGTNGCR